MIRKRKDLVRVCDRQALLMERLSHTLSKRVRILVIGHCPWGTRPARDISSLVGPNVGELDHLGKLLDLGGHEGAELSGRHGHRNVPQIGEPLLQPGIGEAGVGLPVELQ